MILAAGRGERMRPLTDHQPKALCQIHGVPLIEYHIINLAAAKFTHIVVNHAHFGGQIRRHLGSGAKWGIDINYAPEPPGGLETGGGIFNALPLLGNDPFITVNADIYSDFNFLNIQLPINSMAHLILVKKPQHAATADFGLSTKGLIDNYQRTYTFSGIACYDPALFQHQQPGRYAVTPLLRKLACESRATGELYKGQWMDIGTPERLQWAQELI
jgi:MurNAc alpha-1-phosphate uridylyltransferase